MSTNKKVILVVEDDKAIASDLKTLLSFEGYKVFCAMNGAEAIEILRSGSVSPSLVLLDLMMPVMDGWTFREHQSNDTGLATIPVVVMTADGNAAQKAEKMQAQGFLVKPFDISRLLELVAKHVA
jgi:CheY-like chemotaxis protein